jgi:hypothetical protein
MNQFRVLIIVLASDTDPVYCRFQDAWRLASHPRADILFLKAHPDIQGDDFISNDTIFVGCRESLDTVYEKQMRGFRVLLPRLANYAYVLRTNLSSYIDIEKYLAFCETLPRTNVYSGFIGHHARTRFASGSGFTITPDLIRRLVEENPPEIYWDDVSIGGAITSWGIPIIPAPRFDYASSDPSLLDPYIPSNVFHHRIKTSNRETDAQLLTRLFKNGQSVVANANSQ